MCRVVEVIRLKFLDDLHYGVRAQQHCAEDALLGFSVRGRLTEFSVALGNILPVPAIGTLLLGRYVRRPWRYVVCVIEACVCHKAIHPMFCFAGWREAQIRTLSPRPSVTHLREVTAKMGGLGFWIFSLMQPPDTHPLGINPTVIHRVLCNSQVRPTFDPQTRGYGCG
ncbi:Uncharacterised protein [Corynebacterium striatum]|nr:Uncharacterised protein [Corynebacterium striatum]